MGVKSGEVDLGSIVSYLDEYLDLTNVPDYPDACNGLQVENSGRVSVIVACTDACQATIDAATELGADLMLVHHGLFWGDGLRPLTDRHYRRARQLIVNDIAVYSAHIPLDAHAVVGNNAELARLLEMRAIERFGDYQAIKIGVLGELDVTRDELAARLERALGETPRVIPTGPERCRRIGIVTGGASAHIGEARAVGLDTFITGEGPHHSYFDAEEWGINVFFAGHYATETLGVKALAARLSDRFGVDWEFVDHPTGI